MGIEIITNTGKVNLTTAPCSGGGGGAVSSVNGKVGAVVLSAADVGALPADTVFPEEVWVSDTEPTNEDIKLWVNPEETLATKYATEAYVDEAIANVPTGGGNNVYFFEGHSDNLHASITEADKAKLEEIWSYYKENNVLLDCALYFRTYYGSPVYQMVTGAEFYTSSMILNLVSNNRVNGLNIHFDNSGKYSYSSIGSMIDNSYNWKWCDLYGSADSINYSDIGEFTHIKVVGYWDWDTEKMATYDISASFNNSFGEETGCKYYVTEPYHYNRSSSRYFFYNDGSRLTFQTDDGMALDRNNGFTIVGFYYWGVA